MLKIKEYDVEDKEVHFIQEFYRDKYKELKQGIMYLVNADCREIEFTRARVPKVLNTLYKKVYVNQNHEIIKIEYLVEKVEK